MNSKEKFRISPYLTKKNARGITLIALVIIANISRSNN